MSEHIKALGAIQDAIPIVMRELGWDEAAITRYVASVIHMEQRRLANQPHAGALAMMEDVVADHFTFEAAVE